MKVYLASWFASKDERKQQAAELKTAGIEVTSHWLDEKLPGTTLMSEVTQGYLQDTAMVDFEDIARADMLVLFTVDPETGECHRRGGRHVEFGIALGLGIPTVVCGPKENIFCHLPSNRQFDTWDETKAWLIARNRN